MIKDFALNCVSDEIHHPFITKTYRLLLIVAVLLNITLVLLKNKGVNVDQNHLWQFVIYTFFLFDFLLRIIGAGHHYDMENYDESLRYTSLKSYLFSFFGFIDFIVIIPFFLILLQLKTDDLFIAVGLASLLKIARFSPALIILKDVIVSERRSLFAAFYLMMILTISISAVLYFVEREVNPQGFGTLLDSIWWAIITLATVGYGDVVPHTELGKLLGGIAAITGFGMFALPAGILASGFAQEVQRLKDVTNWKMVSNVPLFAELEFGAIAEISRLLHVKRFRKNEIIIQEGAEGDSMYFILEGRVLVHNKELKVELSNGDFFGEIALLKNIPRTANVTAKTRCEILELTTYDFQNFMKKRPEILEEIEKVATKRYKKH